MLCRLTYGFQDFWIECFVCQFNRLCTTFDLFSGQDSQKCRNDSNAAASDNENFVRIHIFCTELGKLPDFDNSLLKSWNYLFNSTTYMFHASAEFVATIAIQGMNSSIVAAILNLKSWIFDYNCTWIEAVHSISRETSSIGRVHRSQRWSKGIETPVFQWHAWHYAFSIIEMNTSCYHK